MATSSQDGTDPDIRKRLIEEDLVDCWLRYQQSYLEYGYPSSGSFLKPAR